MNVPPGTDIKEVYDNSANAVNCAITVCVAFNVVVDVTVVVGVVVGVSIGIICVFVAVGDVGVLFLSHDDKNMKISIPVKKNINFSSFLCLSIIFFISIYY